MTNQGWPLPLHNFYYPYRNSLLSMRNKIPFDWWQFQNKPAYFITYFGDIYYGRICECPNADESFFIVQNDKARALKEGDQSLERYRKLGREICDVGIIHDVIPDNGSRLGYEGQFVDITTQGQQFKRMFVFGAAASTFCVFGDEANEFRNSALNSPTGFEIFDKKYHTFCRKYPGVGLSIPFFNSKNRDIEGCLEEEWLECKNSRNTHVSIRHINIQYYLQELFEAISKNVIENYSRNNLYLLFLHKLQMYLSNPQNQNERIGIVSFNYDTILDTFIQNFFGQFGSLSDYINWHQRQVLLFKPHGSCNWGWKFKPERIADFKQERIADYLYQNQVEPWQVYYNLLGDLNEVVANNSWGYEWSLHEHDLGRFIINKNLLQKIPPGAQNAYFPALLLPYRDKDEFVMPYDHLAAMEHFWGEMEELYLIGWKGNEALFNRLLSKKAHRLKKIVISNPYPDEVKVNLKKYLKLENYEIEEVKNFEQFVLNYLESLF